jgi:hypothetical protein
MCDRYGSFTPPEAVVPRESEACMYADELFVHLDQECGSDWRARIDSEEVKNKIEQWIAQQVGRAVSLAIDNLPEEK